MNESQCKHHWEIESPAGPSSHGVCRLCGDEKDFDNWKRVEGYQRRIGKGASPTVKKSK